MFLKKIEIQGFKSFAKKTALEFEPGITSVVGPNGSGKSNLADAIRWVMGEQSMKAVRSKKSDDVIFAGSDKRSKQSAAEVSITFDNQDRKIPLDFSEVVISRRVYRDGESEYLINKRPVRLMDISEVLSKSGYGGYSYHIISQGSIDQLVLAGPSAVKTLIEEASGVKSYYVKRERAVRKLERTHQNLKRVEDLIGEIEPRLRSLRRQTKRMEQREEIQSELRSSQFSFFTGRFQKIKKDLTDFETRVASFDRQVGDLKNELERREGGLKIIETETQKNSSLYSTVQRELRNLEKEKNSIQEELATTRGQLKVRGVGTTSDQHAQRIRQMEITTKIKELEGNITTLQDQILLSEKNLFQHEKISANLEKELNALLKALEKQDSPLDINSLKLEMEKVYSRYQSLLYSIKNLNSEEDFKSLQQDAGNVEVLLVKIKNKFTHYATTLVGGAINSTGADLQKIYSQKDRVTKEVAKIEGQLATGRAQVEFFLNQVESLKIELSKIEKEKSGEQNEHALPVDLKIKEENLSGELQKFNFNIEKLEADLKKYLDAETQQKQDLLTAERELRVKQDLLSKIKDQKGLVLIEKARHDANLESLFSEIREALGDGYVEKTKSAPVAEFDAGLEHNIHKLKGQLEMIGAVDDLTIQEYKETKERYEYLTSQSGDLKKAVDDLRKVVGELDAIIKKQFQNGFDTINESFSEFFRILFSGGRARMTLLMEQKIQKQEKLEGEAEVEEESKEDLEEEKEALPVKEVLTGIDIKATPPGKKLASIATLSGGERALTAIALLMAILSSYPSPFIVLDEVDAALDEANSIRMGKILSKLAHQTQFITITHNRETMRQSKTLYGVTMGDDGISKVLSIKLDRAVEMAE